MNIRASRLPRHRQAGLSLIEIMVALVVGLILTAGIIHLFFVNAQTYRTTDAVSRIQENGRYALEALGRDLRMAGHQGCAEPRKWPVNIIASELHGLQFPAAALDTSDSNGDGSVDTLTVRYASGNAVLLASDMSTEDAALQLNQMPLGLEAGDIVVVADCTSADAFAVSAVDSSAKTIGHAALQEEGEGQGSTINQSASLSKPYTAGARLMRFRAREFQVRDTGRTNASGAPVFALFRDGEELVEGVESMQVQFGERLSSGNTRYRSWSESGIDFSTVVSVHVGLLLHSIDSVLDARDMTTYEVAGVHIAPAAPEADGVTHGADRRMRRVFSTTISLRNRE